MIQNTKEILKLKKQTNKPRSILLKSNIYIMNVYIHLQYIHNIT